VSVAKLDPIKVAIQRALDARGWSGPRTGSPTKKNYDREAARLRGKTARRSRAVNYRRPQ
jgi:hypothetical protein